MHSLLEMICRGFPLCFRGVVQRGRVWSVRCGVTQPLALATMKPGAHQQPISVRPVKETGAPRRSRSRADMPEVQDHETGWADDETKFTDCAWPWRLRRLPCPCFEAASPHLIMC